MSHYHNNLSRHLDRANGLFMKDFCHNSITFFSEFQESYLDELRRQILLKQLVKVNFLKMEKSKVARRGK